MHDCESVYLIPELLRGAGYDKAVMDWLQLQPRASEEEERQARERWTGYLTRMRNATRQVSIGITGKYTAVRDAYASILKALEHCGPHLGCKVQVVWVDTSELTDATVHEALKDLHGIIVPGAFGTRGAEGKIACLKYARESRLPCLGICYGFQMAVIEFARNVCGMAGADSTEIDNECRYPVIDLLPEQKKIEGLGGSMRLGGHDIVVKEGTLAYRMFGPRTRQRFRHRYEVDPRYIPQLEAAGLIFSGRSPRAEIMHLLELPTSMHPYFVGTQAHPELTSRPLAPQPMFLGLAHAALRRAYSDYNEPLVYPGELTQAASPAAAPRGQGVAK
jgi:CTP synthase